MSEPPLCAPPDPNPRAPRNAIPSGACDCHFHIFDAPSQQVAERGYTAPDATSLDYQHLQATLGLERGVIIQPSIYGTDNRTTLAMSDGDGRMRAVVVVDDSATQDGLEAMSRQGAVGMRANLLFPSGAQTSDLHRLTRTLADVRWHLQILADVSTFQDLERFAADIPVPIVFDHMGHVSATKGVNEPGFQSLLRQLDSGRHWVKLSGAYRVTAGDPCYADVADMARTLVATNPDRLVWGSDWPHPAISGPMPNDGDLLDFLFEWADTETAHKILVRNPETLYGFPKWEASNGA